MKKLLSLKERRKLAHEFLINNGAIIFDFKNRTLIFPDGGLFSIEKEIKFHPRSRFVKIKGGPLKGGLELKRIKGPKVKYEHYKASFWFEELRETINYLKRLEKCLDKMGYTTSQQFKEEYKKKIKKIFKKDGKSKNH